MVRATSKERVDAMWARYVRGLTLSQIAEEFQTSAGRVSKIFSRYGLCARSTGPQIVCRQDFFSVIDTPEKAYWLGVMASDGSIVQTKSGQKRVQIGVQSGDVLWLKDFLTDLESDHEVRTRKDGAVEVNLTSAQLFDDLQRRGVVQNKSLIIDVQEVPLDLQHHYWRGVFDGDGSLPKGQVQITLCVSGSKRFAEGARSWCGEKELSARLVEEHRISKKGKPITMWKVVLTGKSNVCKALDILYHGEGRKLERKFVRAQEILNQCKKSGL